MPAGPLSADLNPRAAIDLAAACEKPPTSRRKSSKSRTVRMSATFTAPVRARSFIGNVTSETSGSSFMDIDALAALGVQVDHSALALQPVTVLAHGAPAADRNVRHRITAAEEAAHAGIFGIVPLVW